MKIKKIAQLCKQEGWAELVNYTDRSGCVQQWITDGRALYPVDGLPHLRAENLPSLLELNDKQKDAMKLRAREAPVSISFADVCEGEKLAQMLPVRVYYGGDMLRPFCVDGKTYWLNEELFLPLLAEHPKAEFYYRHPAGCTEMFDVKAGFMLVGMVMPMTSMQELEVLLRKIAG